MSVPNQTPYNIYTANGLSTVFTYEFYLITTGDLQVSINGNTVTTGYTIAGVGNVNGGDVTFLTPPANGATVMLERVVPTFRLTDYQDNGDLLAGTVNKDFDRLWMAIQRYGIHLGLALRRPLFGGPYNAESYRIANLADPVNDADAATKRWVQSQGQTNLNKTLRVPEAFVASLPSAIARRNMVLAFNSEGNPITVIPGSGDATDVMVQLASTEDGKGDAFIGVKQPITGWPGRTQHDRNFDYLNARDAGAVGDGVTDSTAALQRYADYLASLQQGLTPPYAPPAMDIPPGDYGVSSPSWFTQSVHIRAKGVRIFPLPGFTGVEVPLQGGGTETFNGLFLFLNGKKGADSSQGVLRFNVTIDTGLVLDCRDIAYPNIYMERFVNSSINCTLQSSVHDGLVVGPSSWGLNTENLIVENFADAAIRLMERSAVNGAKLNVRIWGNFKEGNCGIQFDSESACNVVVITGFIEKVKYGIIFSRSTGPVSIVGVDFEYCRFNVIRAAGNMSDGRRIGPISIHGGFLHSSDGSKIYSEGAVVKVNDTRMYTGGTGDFETDSAKTGVILFDNCQFDAGAVGIVDAANVRGSYTHPAGQSIYNYTTNSTETFSTSYEIKNFEWAGFPLTQSSGFGFRSRSSVADNRNYGASDWWVSDRTSDTVQTVVGARLNTDGTRYLGPMLDNLLRLGAPSARWTTIHAVSGTIDTSDEREKQQQRGLFDAERRAALDIKASIRAFKRNDEVDSTGDDAKWHFGVMAQGVADILKNHGLSPDDYDFLSHEYWDGAPEVIDDKTGFVLSPEIEPGSRWGVKYSQLLCFIISVL